jgi:hypothetical protein
MDVLKTSSIPDIDVTQRSGIMQRWFVIQVNLYKRRSDVLQRQQRPVFLKLQDDF